jgi:hypothetical protein
MLLRGTDVVAHVLREGWAVSGFGGLRLSAVRHAGDGAEGPAEQGAVPPTFLPHTPTLDNFAPLTRAQRLTVSKPSQQPRGHPCRYCWDGRGGDPYGLRAGHG